MKVVSIVGARPQFIKMAALNRGMQNFSGFDSVILHTGQHYDNKMSEVFFKEMDIPDPKYNLGINQMERSLLINRMTTAIADVLIEEKPAMVIVFGDTNTTLAGALAAEKENYPIVHIEAGLRSGNHDMPEEVNRIQTDQMSNLLFAPTCIAYDNLIAEKLNNLHQKVIMSGDIMLDAFNYYKKRIENISCIPFKLPADFILCSLHRVNLIKNYLLLEQVIKALNTINENVPVILAAHPMTFQVIQNLNVSSSFRIIPPQSYFSMLHLLARCKMVITDSGGLQKEAYFSKKMCLTVREETEWKELVNAGVNVVSGFDYEDILTAYSVLSNSNAHFNENFYGDGNSTGMILNEICAYSK